MLADSLFMAFCMYSGVLVLITILYALGLLKILKSFKEDK